MIAEMITMFTSALNAMWFASNIKEVQMGFGMFLGLLITVRVLKNKNILDLCAVEREYGR